MKDDYDDLDPNKIIEIPMGVGSGIPAGRFADDREFPPECQDGSEEYFDAYIAPKIRELQAEAARRGIPILTIAGLNNHGRIAAISTVKNAERLPIPALLALVLNHFNHPNAMDMIRAAVSASRDPVLLRSLVRSVLYTLGIDPTGMSMEQMAAAVTAHGQRMSQDAEDALGDLLDGIDTDNQQLN